VGKGAVPVNCRQCEGAPCMMVCPSKAISRKNALDPVIIDNDACVGCRSCVIACPYGVPEMNQLRGSIVKCDLCIERIDADQAPACVEACGTGALCFQTGEEATDSASIEPLWLRGVKTEEGENRS